MAKIPAKMNSNKKRILVVDDEPNITFALRLLFQRANEYEIRVENVATRALAVAEEFQPDLILLDVAMPHMDGGELASRLSESPTLKGVPVVFLTASVTKKEVSARGGLIGGLPFLAKPVDPAELLSCLRRHLGICSSENPWPAHRAGGSAH